ncbi:MAG TPA: hypothetical protein VG652_09650 [Gaiellaceae bacterium]|nr:hypothetical protein [Gaiellaceae bacterium]
MKKKKSDEDDVQADEERLTSLRSHPNAGPAIRRVRAFGGLAGFGVAALIGFDGGSPFAATVERALEVGIASQTVAWAAAMLIWKRLLIAQAGAIARSHRKPTGA